MLYIPNLKRKKEKFQIPGKYFLLLLLLFLAKPIYHIVHIILHTILI